MNERDNETKQHIDLNKRITRWKRKNKAGILNRIILKYGNYSHERDFAVVYVNPHRVIPELGLNRRIPETFHSAEDHETPRKQGKKKNGEKKKTPPSRRTFESVHSRYVTNTNDIITKDKQHSKG